jgi:hypothetical protein
VQVRDRKAIDIEFEVCDRIMPVKLGGYLAGCKCALPAMIAQGRGAIVDTTSTGGFARGARALRRPTATLSCCCCTPPKHVCTTTHGDAAHGHHAVADPDADPTRPSAGRAFQPVRGLNVRLAARHTAADPSMVTESI